jgi:ABC-type transporter Mla MlaB component
MDRNSASQLPHDLFSIEGTLDAHSERMLQEMVSRVKHSVVRFDFSRAGRINSMGIALLLRSFKEIREQKKAEIHLDGLTQMHSMLFKMTGVFLLAAPGTPGK